MKQWQRDFRSWVVDHHDELAVVAEAGGSSLREMTALLEAIGAELGPKERQRGEVEGIAEFRVVARAGALASLVNQLAMRHYCGADPTPIALEIRAETALLDALRRYVHLCPSMAGGLIILDSYL